MDCLNRIHDRSARSIAINLFEHLKRFDSRLRHLYLHNTLTGIRNHVRLFNSYLGTINAAEESKNTNPNHRKSGPKSRLYFHNLKPDNRSSVNKTHFDKTPYPLPKRRSRSPIRDTSTAMLSQSLVQRTSH